MTKPSKFDFLRVHQHWLLIRMDLFLDNIWLKLMALVHYIALGIDFMLAPLNPMGPSVMILAVAFVTVVIIKIFSKIYKTRRYIELKKEFDYWLDIRKEAMAIKDGDQGRTLAKNIDQARLNRVYYDLFFEGLLGTLLTKYIPVFLMLAYVNETFKADNLLKHFGQAYIFKFVNYNGKSIVIGAVFWYAASIFLVFLIWFFAEYLYGKYIKK